MKNLVCLTLLFALLGNINAQNSKYGFSINLNHNLYLPRNSENSTLYILGFPNEQLNVGSFGIGASAYYQYSKRLAFKGGFHVSSLTCIEPELKFTDNNNNSITTFKPVVRDVQNAWSVIAHYYMGTKFSVGAGLGANVRITGTREINSDVLADFDNLDSKISDRKRVLPVLPFEISYAGNRILWNIRLEYALLNRYKGDYAKFKTEKINILYFEIGYFLQRHKHSEE